MRCYLTPKHLFNKDIYHFEPKRIEEKVFSTRTRYILYICHNFHKTYLHDFSRFGLDMFVTGHKNTVTSTVLFIYGYMGNGLCLYIWESGNLCKIFIWNVIGILSHRALYWQVKASLSNIMIKHNKVMSGEPHFAPHFEILHFINLDCSSPPKLTHKAERSTYENHKDSRVQCGFTTYLSVNLFEFSCRESFLIFSFCYKNF